ncbi:MAG: hypothetical protein ABI649_07595 [Gaiellaceae bacterium]
MRRVYLVLLAGLVALAFAGTAQAWKPPTHEKGVELPLLQMVTGNTVTIDDISGDPTKAVTVQANPTIVQALRQYPDAYRAGVMGPDAWPDMYFGQSQIHPDTRTHNGRQAQPQANKSITDEWLSYLWEAAWRPDPSIYIQSFVPIPLPADYVDQRLRNIAFVVGYIAGHANGDMWAHTFMNSPALANGVFPDFTDVKHGDIAIKHTIVEGYIDKHRPGYKLTSYPIDPPKEFIVSTLLLSDFARDHADHVILDPFTAKFWELQRDIEELEFDNTHQDCSIDDAEDCTAIQHQPLGDQSSHTHFVCQVHGCGPDISDSPINFIELGIDSALLAYYRAWQDDIKDGLVAWVDMNRVVAEELFAGKKADITKITDAAHDWILAHYLSMLGFPDFVGNGILFVSDVVSEVTSFFFSCSGNLWGPLRNDPVFGAALGPACDFYDRTKQDILGAVGNWADGMVAGMLTELLGLRDLPVPMFQALDQSGDGALSPKELIRVLTEPEELITDPRIFPLPVRQLVDNAMDLLPGVDVDGDESAGIPESFRAYQIDGFAALKDTQTMGQLSLLDENGLNSFFKQKAAQAGDSAGLGNLYNQYFNYNSTQQPAARPPNNVMLGWMRAMDGNHQWSTTSLYLEDDDPTDSTPPQRFSYGDGRMWLWEDCVARAQVWKKVFVEPVPWHNPGQGSFEDTFDAPSNISDNQAPQVTLALSGASSTSGTTLYVGGGATLTAKAADNYDPLSRTKLFVRLFQTGSSAPTWGGASASNPETVALGGGADGAYTVEAKGSDGCGNESGVESEDLVLDTAGPVITITSPQPEDVIFDTDDLSSIAYTAVDSGAGTASDSVTFDGAAAANGQSLDMYLLAPGTHTIVVTATDELGNESTLTRHFRVQASAGSLMANIQRAWNEGLITSMGAYNGLLEKLNQALVKHAQGQHGAERNLLVAFINQLLAKRGSGVDAATADRFIAFARDLIERDRLASPRAAAKSSVRRHGGHIRGGRSR